MNRFARARAKMAVVALIATAVTACAPIVAHGPQVQPGLTAGATVAIGGGPTYENGDDPGPYMVGRLVANAGYGWRFADGRAPALRLGVHTPGLGGFGTDVYVQAPPRWLGPAAIGAGLLSEGTGRHMPYVQAGVQDRAGLGLHVVLGHYTNHWEAPTHIGDERATVGWLSVQVPLGSRVTAHLHGGYARGHVTKRSARTLEEFSRENRVLEVYVDQDRWSNLGGITFELHRKRR